MKSFDDMTKDDSLRFLLLKLNNLKNNYNHMENIAKELLKERSSIPNLNDSSRVMAMDVATLDVNVYIYIIDICDMNRKILMKYLNFNRIHPLYNLWI